MVEGRVPPGLNDEAVKKVKEGCDSTETFKKENLNLLLDTGTRQSLYRDSVRKVFEATWDIAILPYQPKPTIGGAPDDGGSGSSTSTMGAGPARRTGDAAEEFRRMDEDEIFSMVEAESKARDQKRLRTVTVSSKDIVRQELLDMKMVRESKDESLEGPEQATTAFAEMIRILQEKQEVLANATDELACLGRKTTILMSQNRFSTPGQSETGLEPEPLQKRETPITTPAPSISSLHPIPLGAAALYEILCSNGPYHFDARIDDTHLISSVDHANKNQSTVFGNFFDMDKIHGICSGYGLHFADRISYINPYTVRILGEVVPAYQDRGGRPIVSDLDEAKKDKTRKRTDRDWGREGSRTGISQEAARKRLVDIEKDLKELESLQEEKRQKWLKADQDRYELSVHERELSKAGRRQRASERKVKAPRTAQQQQAYQDLFQARRTADILFLDWLKNDSRLRDLRATRKNGRKKLATDTPNAIATRAAHAELSSNSINTALTLDAIDSAHGVRRGARQACREFEGGKWRLKDLRDQEIRTKRVYATLAAEQRSNAKEAVIKDSKSKAPTSIPRKRNVAVVVLHGAAGTSVGSRIKGHQKRGGSKLTKEHRMYGTVAHTNENRTSRVCSCCFMPVFLSRGQRD
ncbi:hypothetical protein EC957_009424 [Mortierella hygrophila]|uniref:Uncharacterized protein n=1 Tax=Mortierella hygrophila TaxID=979708 RepID=A0A9P6EX36_9FUNG|nr:hypothetical protein EC957_009424 [Mortierella hygrophila]